jgi:hypothetical protein
MVRQNVLHNILRRGYGEFLDLSEAITAIRSKGLLLEHHEEEAIGLLDRWRRREEIRQYSPTLAAGLYQPGDLEETINVLQLLKKLQFFYEDYTINLPRPPWIDPAQWKREVPLKMSDNEKCRFMRALCRLQMYANILGPPEMSGQWREREGQVLFDNYVTDEKHYRLFLGVLPPWEVHEMGCVWSYLMSKYNPVFEKISDGLREAMKNEPSRFFWDVLPDDECPPPAIIDTVADLRLLPTYTEVLASLGPDFLYRVLHTTSIPQRNMVIANLNTAYLSPLDGWFPTWEDRMPLTDPADRHCVRNFEQFWSTLPPIDQPNLGWRKLGLVPHSPEQELEDALNTYSDQNLEKEWPWGYALWDDVRLKKWEAPLLRDGRGDAPLLLLPAP